MKYGEYMNFGQTLKYYRKERHISQEDLSCGICDRKYVSNVENNKCIPSLYMVYLLSEKLNIDLFSKYAQTMRHKNIETHRLIEKISDSLRAEKTISEILPLLDCCKELEDFKTGEPFQCLNYGYAAYYLCVKKEYKIARNYLQNALFHHYEDETKLLFAGNHFSNIELACLLSLATTLFECEEQSKSKNYFLFLFDYFDLLFSESRYSVNSNYHFELNFVGKVLFNYFLTFPEESIETGEQVDKILDFLRRYDSSCNLTELLLCKAKVEKARGNDKAAETVIKQAQTIGQLYRSTDYVNRQIKRLDLG